MYVIEQKDANHLTIEEVAEALNTNTAFVAEVFKRKGIQPVGYWQRPGGKGKKPRLFDDVNGDKFADFFVGETFPMRRKRKPKTGASASVDRDEMGSRKFNEKAALLLLGILIVVKKFPDKAVPILEVAYEECSARSCGSTREEMREMFGEEPDEDDFEIDEVIEGTKNPLQLELPFETPSSAPEPPVIEASSFVGNVTKEESGVVCTSTRRVLIYNEDRVDEDEEEEEDLPEVEEEDEDEIVYIEVD